MKNCYVRIQEGKNENFEKLYILTNRLTKRSKSQNKMCHMTFQRYSVRRDIAIFAPGPSITT